MTTTFGALFSRWLAVGLGMLGVVGAVVFVMQESQPWLSAGTLLFTIVALALILTRVNSRSFTLVAHRRATRERLLPPVEPPAPLWLLSLALIAIAITAAAADNLATGTATNGAVVHRWLISMGLILLAARWHPLPQRRQRDDRGWLRP